MGSSLNALRWDGQPGHYEVYYLTLTEPDSGVGVWIRYTMVAPLLAAGEPATASLWFLAMDPRPGRTPTFGRKATVPIDRMEASTEPFELAIDGARLRDDGMAGAFEDVAWDLRWTAGRSGYEHVHPALQRLGVAKTVLVLPHADLADRRHDHARRTSSSSCTARAAARRTCGGPSTRARGRGCTATTSRRWTATPRPGRVRRRRVGVRPAARARGRAEHAGRRPRIDGGTSRSTSPLRVIANDSTFALTGWRFEAVDGDRKLVGEVDADRDQLAGVTYHDPDGELAYCYNSETASMRLHVYERARQVGGWAHRDDAATRPAGPTSSTRSERRSPSSSC